eukprot:TRINITY_DN1544_c3_g1_i5.p1 TRINITY_DN1544_c3_g1~~TRINITY_DN1544_c3_g1_i5.p1  ORF type:complete len:4907 (+),score=2611.56 TRINITY_DN1544_c3_g1_i5:95-14722(+)
MEDDNDQELFLAIALSQNLGPGAESFSPLFVESPAPPLPPEESEESRAIKKYLLELQGFLAEPESIFAFLNRVEKTLSPLCVLLGERTLASNAFASFFCPLLELVGLSLLKTKASSDVVFDLMPHFGFLHNLWTSLLEFSLAQLELTKGRTTGNEKAILDNLKFFLFQQETSGQVSEKKTALKTLKVPSFSSLSAEQLKPLQASSSSSVSSLSDNPLAELEALTRLSEKNEGSLFASLVQMATEGFVSKPETIVRLLAVIRDTLAASSDESGSEKNALPLASLLDLARLLSAQAPKTSDPAVSSALLALIQQLIDISAQPSTSSLSKSLEIAEELVGLFGAIKGSVATNVRLALFAQAVWSTTSALEAHQKPKEEGAAEKQDLTLHLASLFSVLSRLSSSLSSFPADLLHEDSAPQASLFLSGPSGKIELVVSTPLTVSGASAFLTSVPLFADHLIKLWSLTQSLIFSPKSETSPASSTPSSASSSSAPSPSPASDGGDPPRPPPLPKETGGPKPRSILKASSTPKSSSSSSSSSASPSLSFLIQNEAKTPSSPSSSSSSSNGSQASSSSSSSTQAAKSVRYAPIAQIFTESAVVTQVLRQSLTKDHLEIFLEKVSSSSSFLTQIKKTDENAVHLALFEVPLRLLLKNVISGSNLDLLMNLMGVSSESWKVGLSRPFCSLLTVILLEKQKADPSFALPLWNTFVSSLLQTSVGPSSTPMQVDSNGEAEETIKKPVVQNTEESLLAILLFYSIPEDQRAEAFKSLLSLVHGIVSEHLTSITNLSTVSTAVFLMDFLLVHFDRAPDFFLQSIKLKLLSNSSSAPATSSVSSTATLSSFQSATEGTPFSAKGLAIFHETFPVDSAFSTLSSLLNAPTLSSDSQTQQLYRSFFSISWKFLLKLSLHSEPTPITSSSSSSSSSSSLSSCPVVEPDVLLSDKVSSLLEFYLLFQRRQIAAKAEDSKEETTNVATSFLTSTVLPTLSSLNQSLSLKGRTISLLNVFLLLVNQTLSSIKVDAPAPTPAPAPAPTPASASTEAKEGEAEKVEKVEEVKSMLPERTAQAVGQLVLDLLTLFQTIASQTHAYTLDVVSNGLENKASLALINESISASLPRPHLVNLIKKFSSESASHSRTEFLTLDYNTLPGQRRIAILTDDAFLHLIESALSPPIDLQSPPSTAAFSSIIHATFSICALVSQCAEMLKPLSLTSACALPSSLVDQISVTSYNSLFYSKPVKSLRDQILSKDNNLGLLTLSIGTNFLQAIIDADLEVSLWTPIEDIITDCIQNMEKVKQKLLASKQIDSSLSQKNQSLITKFFFQLVNLTVAVSSRVGTKAITSLEAMLDKGDKVEQGTQIANLLSESPDFLTTWLTKVLLKFPEEKKSMKRILHWLRVIFCHPQGEKLWERLIDLVFDRASFVPEIIPAVSRILLPRNSDAAQTVLFVNKISHFLSSFKDSSSSSSSSSSSPSSPSASYLAVMNHVLVMLLKLLEEKPQTIEIVSAIHKVPTIEELKDTLCTFTSSGRNYEDQHWYFCYTCNLTERKGVCSKCALICHRGHDLSYSKHSSFYCDCGSAENNVTCKALVPRPSKASSSPSSSSSSVSSETLADQKQIYYDAVLKTIGESSVLSSIQTLSQPFIEALGKTPQQDVKMIDDEAKEVVDVFSSNKTISYNEFLTNRMSVRLSVDLKNKIEKLPIRRDAKAVLNYYKNGISVANNGLIAIGEREGLVVGRCAKMFGDNLKASLSAKSDWKLLGKQVLPFDPLYVSVNPENSNFIACSGIENCSVVTLNDDETPDGQIDINLALDYADASIVMKTLWYPGSEVKLAIVTTKFVKIFDLSQSAAEPIHYYFLIEDTITDAAFAPDPARGGMVLLISSTSGFIYRQFVSEDAIDPSGCIVMDSLPLPADYLTGVTISALHFSAPTNVLYVSFEDGRSIAARMDEGYSDIFECLVLVSADKKIHFPYSNFVEAADPGVIAFYPRKTNLVVALRLEAANVHYQTLKTSSKIEGISFSPVTGLVVLQEDGTLIRFTSPPASSSSSSSSASKASESSSSSAASPSSSSSAAPEGLSSSAASLISSLISSSSVPGLLSSAAAASSKRSGSKTTDAKSLVTANSTTKSKRQTLNNFIFPATFFEKLTAITPLCQLTKENPEKTRFGSDEYLIEIAAPKTHVVLGLRIMVANSESVKKITVFDRSFSCTNPAPRFYDIPLTIEEVLEHEKVQVSVGGRREENLADNIVVYGQTKSDFGFQDKLDQFRLKKQLGVLTQSFESSELLLLDAFKSLTLYFVRCKEHNIEPSETARQAATSTLQTVLPHLHSPLISVILQTQIKDLLSATTANSDQYHLFLDNAVSSHAAKQILHNNQLLESKSISFSAEDFIELLNQLVAIGSERTNNFRHFIDQNPTAISASLHLFGFFQGQLSKAKANSTLSKLVRAFSSLLYCYAKFLVSTDPSRSLSCVLPSFVLLKDLLLDSSLSSLTISAISNLVSSSSSAPAPAKSMEDDEAPAAAAIEDDEGDEVYPGIDPEDEDTAMKIAMEMSHPKVFQLPFSEGLSLHQILGVHLASHLSAQIETDGSKLLESFALLFHLLKADLDSEKNVQFAASIVQNLLSKTIKALAATPGSTRLLESASIVFRLFTALLKRLSAPLSGELLKAVFGQKAEEGQGASVEASATSEPLIDDLFGLYRRVLADITARPSLVQASSGSADGSGSGSAEAPRQKLLKSSKSAGSKVSDTSADQQTNPLFSGRLAKAAGAKLFQNAHELFVRSVSLLFNRSLTALQTLSKDPAQDKDQTPVPIASLPALSSFDVAQWTSVATSAVTLKALDGVLNTVEKLLITLTGSTELSNQLKDSSKLELAFKQIGSLFYDAKGSVRELSYEETVKFVSFLSEMWVIADARASNWQHFVSAFPDTLQTLIRILFALPPDHCLIVLRLVANVFIPHQVLEKAKLTHLAEREKEREREKAREAQKRSKKKEKTSAVPAPTTTTTTTATLGESGEVKKDLSESDTLMIGASSEVAQQFIPVMLEGLDKFVTRFFLESSSKDNRVEARNLVHWIWKQATEEQRTKMLQSIVDNIPHFAAAGSNARELFTELRFMIGDSSLDDETNSLTVKQLVENLLKALEEQNRLLGSHPNSYLYQRLRSYIDLDGYYLESETCSICHSPEKPFSLVDRSSICKDLLATENVQMFRFKARSTLQMLSISLSPREARSGRSPKLINIYYNNQPVKELSELKGQPARWRLARTVNIEPKQTSIDVHFPIPITACNLMLDFVDFHLGLEKVMCRKCHIPAIDSTCSGCSDNVYQCPHCQTINYENKHAFLCLICSDCHYFRINYRFKYRPSFESETIETDEDLAKAQERLNEVSQEADKHYNEILSHKRSIQLYLSQIAGDSRSPSPSSLHELLQSNGEIHKLEPSLIQALVQSKGRDPFGALRDTYSKAQKSFNSLSESMQQLLSIKHQLVQYTQQQSSAPVVASSSSSGSGKCEGGHKANRCYGCATEFLSQALRLLGSLAKNNGVRASLLERGFIQEIISNNLQQGSNANKADARSLLVRLVNNNYTASNLLLSILTDKIKYCLANHKTLDLGVSIKSEMKLFVELSTDTKDQFWESRLRLLFQLFMQAIKLGSSNPSICEHIILPCLEQLNSQIFRRPSTSSSTSSSSSSSPSSSSSSSSSSSTKTSYGGLSFFDWVQFKTSLAEWKDSSKSEMSKSSSSGLVSSSEKINSLWITKLLFNKSSKPLRDEAVKLLRSLAYDNEGQEPNKEISVLISHMLQLTPDAGDSSTEFFELYKQICATDDSKLALAAEGELDRLLSSITREIRRILETERAVLVSSSSSSSASGSSLDVSQGFVLKQLIDTLMDFLKNAKVLATYKSDKIVAQILDSYLMLKGLVMQSTKLTDSCTKMLFDFLKQLSTDANDIQLYMTACIRALEINRDDAKTSQFIYQQLCDIVCPSKEAPVYKLVLYKDPSSEEYIMGNMQRTPYLSSEVGPLMRDLKNKIANTTGLAAAVDSDEVLELIVASKIINLALPINAVYEQVWSKDARNKDNPMKIIYRIRGLTEATEESVDSLKEEEEMDPEEEFKVTAVMSMCGGLEVMVDQISRLHDLETQRQLAHSVFTLLLSCLKIKVNRQKILLIEPLSVLIEKLRLAFQLQSRSIFAEQLLQIIELIISEANVLLVSSAANSAPSSPRLHRSSSSSSVPLSPSPSSMKDDGEGEGEGETAEVVALGESGEGQSKTEQENVHQIEIFLEKLSSSQHQSNKKLLHNVCRVLPYVTYGQPAVAKVFAEFFQPFCDLSVFDETNDESQRAMLECLSVSARSIPMDQNGKKLRQYLLRTEFTQPFARYIQQTLGQHEAQSPSEWRQALNRKALPFALQIFGGLAKGHAPTQQLALDLDLIGGLIHASRTALVNAVNKPSGRPSEGEETIGNVSESVLSSLQLDNAKVAQVVSDHTKRIESANKSAAMDHRLKVLKNIGLGFEGNKIALPSAFSFAADEEQEETGLVCRICFEGYTYRPTDTLGFYVNVQPKEQLYSSASNFTTLHFSCHRNAAKADADAHKEEWEGASMRNSNCPCNNLFPILGPSTDPADYAQQVEKYWTLQQNRLGRVDSTRFRLMAHDLAFLFLRYAKEEAIPAGGSKATNFKCLPFFLQMGLYLLDLKSLRKSVDASFTSFLLDPLRESPSIDDAFYYLVVSLFVLSQAEWTKYKPLLLERCILDGTRITLPPLPSSSSSSSSSGSAGVSASGSSSSAAGEAGAEDEAKAKFRKLRPSLLFFSLIDKLQMLFKPSKGKLSSESEVLVSHEPNEDWITEMKEQIKTQDVVLVDKVSAILTEYEEYFLTLETPEEFFTEFLVDEHVSSKASSADEFVANILKLAQPSD